MELYLIPDNNGAQLQQLYTQQLITHNNSVLNHYENEGYADSGFDLFIPPSDSDDGSWLVMPNTTVKIPLGIKIIRTDKKYYMPIGMQNPERLTGRTLPYPVYPRSSIYKTSVRLANNVGIIDSGYRGEFMAVFDNIRNTEYRIEPYQRLVQACMPDLAPFGVRLVDNDFTQTSRGDGGFGSTGL